MLFRSRLPGSAPGHHGAAHADRDAHRLCDLGIGELRDVRPVGIFRGRRAEPFGQGRVYDHQRDGPSAERTAHVGVRHNAGGGREDPDRVFLYGHDVHGEQGAGDADRDDLELNHEAADPAAGEPDPEEGVMEDFPTDENGENAAGDEEDLQGSVEERGAAVPEENPEDEL